MIREEKKFKIERFDLSIDKSLRAWNAAGEYLLQAYNALEVKPKHLGIYNDRFGYLSCHLNPINSTTIITNKSQEKAIQSNIKANDLDTPCFSNPFSILETKMDLILVIIPKSLDLFRVFLEQITHNSTENITVSCAFMTRNFSPKMLEIAAEYFEEVDQSRAVKKARLLFLRKKKKAVKRNIINTVNYNNQDYKQFFGVFSADHIDYATQFFLKHIELKENDNQILDLASGNGIVGNEIFKKLPNSEIHLMDDSFLAVASAKLNMEGNRIHHHYNNDLNLFEDNTFNLIATNPPFHFEYEINIQVPIQLFKDCFRCLKNGGNLQIVANKHLNYKVHLEPIYSDVKIIAEDKKFVVYKCTK